MCALNFYRNCFWFHWSYGLMMGLNILTVNDIIFIFHWILNFLIYLSPWNNRDEGDKGPNYKKLQDIMKIIEKGGWRRKFPFLDFCGWFQFFIFFFLSANLGKVGAEVIWLIWLI